MEVSRESYLLSVIITSAVRCVDTLYCATEQEPVELVNREELMNELMALIGVEVSRNQLENTIQFLQATIHSKSKLETGE